MTLFDNVKNEQSADGGGINANRSVLTDVGNDYSETNYHTTIIINQLRSSSNDFQNLLPKNLDSSDPQIAKKITALQMGYLQNLDIDEQIKQIYDQCHRICIKQLSDDAKYRIIKNIIKIIPDLTSADLLLIKEITSKEIIKRPEYYNQPTENTHTYKDLITKFSRLVDLSLINFKINLEETNRNIKEPIQKAMSTLDEQDRNLSRVQDTISSIQSSGKFGSPYSSLRTSNWGRFSGHHEDFISYEIEISKGCKVISEIVNDIRNSGTHFVTPELEAKIWEILNN